MKNALKGLAVLLTTILLALAARQWLAGTVKIAGSSMSGTLVSGDIVLVTRFDYLGGKTPARGDVVQCRFPNRSGSYVKRVIGLPGETVEFSGGALYIDGVRILEPYVTSPTGNFSAKLNTNEYLVLGDNRVESYDSRAEDMGCIPQEDLLGRVRLILWPFNRIDIVE